MRYSKDHRAATRRRIVDAAARAFRRDGIAATGIAGLMAEADLTVGGFYLHFASKEALVAEVMDVALAATLDNARARMAAAAAAGDWPLGAVIDAYLSDVHVGARDVGCALASLGSEIGQQGPAVRAAADRRVREIVDALADALPVGARYRAGPLFAMLAGTLQMAWLATGDAERSAILAAGRRSARAFAQAPVQAREPDSR